MPFLNTIREVGRKGRERRGGEGKRGGGGAGWGEARRGKARKGGRQNETWQQLFCKVAEHTSLTLQFPAGFLQNKVNSLLVKNTLRECKHPKWILGLQFHAVGAAAPGVASSLSQGPPVMLVVQVLWVGTAILPYDKVTMLMLYEVENVKSGTFFLHSVSFSEVQFSSCVI